MHVWCEGVRRASVSLMAQKANVDYLSDLISADDIVEHIVQFGFSASLLETTSAQQGSVELQVVRSLHFFPFQTSKHFFFSNPTLHTSGASSD